MLNEIAIAAIDKGQVNSFSILKNETQEKKAVATLSPLLDKLLACDESSVQAALGDVGVNLRRLAQMLDRSHPDLVFFREGALLDGNTYARRLCQIMDAWFASKNAGLDDVLPLYRKMSRQGLPNAFLGIRNPQENQQFVRLVSDPAKRHEIRNTKEVRPLYLYPFWKKGESAWHIQPPDFDLFTPGSKNYEKQIAEARKKADRFKALGCADMTKAVMDSVTEFLATFERQSYEGFYRITATNAAIILAKLHGYAIQTPARSLDARMLRVPEVYGQFFKSKSGGQPIENDAERMLIEELERMVAAVTSRDGDKKTTLTVARSSSASLIYAPTIYPLPAFLKLVYGITDLKDAHPTKQYQVDNIAESVDVCRLIQHIENFPAMNGKPLFDHFLVVVPSPQPLFWDSKQTDKKQTDKNKPAPEEKTEYIVSKGEEIFTFANSMDAKICLDTMLVRDRLIAPALLGERDGQCYFLSFWY